MSGKKIRDPQAALWLASAMAAPLVQISGRSHWNVVLLAGLVCLAALWYLERYLAEPGPWLHLLQNLWLCVLISELLHWCAAVWPGQEDAWAAPALVLILAVWLASGRGTASTRAGCVILWPVLLMLGAVLLSAVPEVKPDNLTAQWKGNDMSLLTVLLIFPLCVRCMGKGGSRTYGRMIALGAVVSLACTGVLSRSICLSQPSPIYEMSRSVSLFGVAERVESITAAAMTMGYFTSISCLLAYTKDRDVGRRTWIYAVLAMGLFLLDIRLKDGIVAMGVVLLWVILPLLQTVKKGGQKRENALDK